MCHFPLRQFLKGLGCCPPVGRGPQWVSEHHLVGREGIDTAKCLYDYNKKIIIVYKDVFHIYV